MGAQRVTLRKGPFHLGALPIDGSITGDEGDGGYKTPSPLEGIRVLDFTWVRAGPLATRWLGALGAEVIKVEWPENMDILWSNRFTTMPGIEPSPNSVGQFNDTNANKLGITLNVRSPKGLELIRRLIAISDIVIENFSSRIMQRWGLSYEEMTQ